MIDDTTSLIYPGFLVVAVVGSREFSLLSPIYAALHSLNERFGHHIVVISGGARGADSIAKHCALLLHLEYFPRHFAHDAFCPYPPEYYSQPYQVSYYEQRDQHMARDCHVLYAFYASLRRTPGTRKTVGFAQALGKPTLEYPHARFSIHSELKIPDLVPV